MNELARQGVLQWGHKCGTLGIMEKAKHYRERAEELRTIAQDRIDQDSQQTLLRMAREYEHMAEVRERDIEREQAKRN